MFKGTLDPLFAVTLRNHAFSLCDHHYVLSPAFDINPSIYETSFELPFGGVINKEGLLDESKYFNISKDDADSIYNRIGQIITEKFTKYKKEYPSVSKQIDRILQITSARM